MAIAPTKTRSYTAEEYLDLEVDSDVRSEFRNGEIVPMTGGTPAHNSLITALSGMVWLALRGKPFRSFVADQRLWVPGADIYTYPDVMVVRKPLEFLAGRKDTVMNPVLVVEVLSKSTEGYDRGDKFTAYGAIAALQEYVLVSQYRVQVDRFLRQGDGSWRLERFTELGDILALASVPVEIALADLYEEVEFEG